MNCVTCSATPLAIIDSVVACMLTANGTLNASRFAPSAAVAFTVVGAGVPALTGNRKACVPVAACGVNVCWCGSSARERKRSGELHHQLEGAQAPV